MGMLRTLGYGIISLMVLPLVLIMRLCAPFVRVRIFVISLDRIGSVLPHFDTYMRKREMGLNETGCLDIFCFKRGKIANTQIPKMITRVVKIRPIAFWVDKLNRRIPGWQRHVVPMECKLDRGDADETTSIPLRFSPEELTRGRAELEKMGIPAQTPFICFHARDAAYLRTYQPIIDWDYHSYRNADINNYVPAAEWMVKRGYYAVRMGRHVEKKIRSGESRIIDYAAKGGTDFMDIYLGSQCRFFIAGSDGLAKVPTIFRRPVIWVDFVPLSALDIILPGQLFIPKKYWLIKEGRWMTFAEMLGPDVASYNKTGDFEKADIKVVNNTPEEIVDVTMEMEDRLNGTWRQTEEDRVLHERFLEIVTAGNKRRLFGTIGTKFLREHKDWLGHEDFCKLHTVP